MYPDNYEISRIMRTGYGTGQRLDEDRRTCSQCLHFLGCGDFNLCCSIHSGLYYEADPACEDFIPID